MKGRDMATAAKTTQTITKTIQEEEDVITLTLSGDEASFLAATLMHRFDWAKADDGTYSGAGVKSARFKAIWDALANTGVTDRSSLAAHHASTT